ncbi:MAG: carboxypeptidase regulatory-like domain-containing protein, partial [Terriglobia bacterium]
MTARPSHTSLLGWLPLILLLGPLILWAQAVGQLYGHVRTIGADGQPLYLVGARVVLGSKTDPSIHFETLSDETGAYSFKAVPAGSYRLAASLEGYQEATQEVGVEPGVLLEATLELELEAVHEEITVRGEAEGLETEQTAPKTVIKGPVLRNAPLASERFLEALPLVPGVVRGPDGLLKVKGARSTQTGWLVNSANITDPVTGEQAINLPIDVIQKIDVLPNPYAAEYGKFAGAVTAIETTPATTKFKFRLDNFLPRFRRRAGSYRGVESATPRLTLSGPIVKGKLAFLQSFEYRLNRLPITSLPELEQDMDIESFDSFTQLDATFNPNHSLTPVLSFYPQKNRFATLDTFNPQPVTANYRQRGWMGGVKDRYLFSNGSLLESNLSVKDFDADIFPATAGEPFIPPSQCAAGPLPPRSGEAFILRPECNFGRFFNTQNRISRR